MCKIGGHLIRKVTRHYSVQMDAVLQKVQCFLNVNTQVQEPKNYTQIQHLSKRA